MAAPNGKLFSCPTVLLAPNPRWPLHAGTPPPAICLWVQVVGRCLCVCVCDCESCQARLLPCWRRPTHATATDHATQTVFKNTHTGKRPAAVLLMKAFILLGPLANFFSGSHLPCDRQSTIMLSLQRVWVRCLHETNTEACMRINGTCPRRIPWHASHSTFADVWRLHSGRSTADVM